MSPLRVPFVAYQSRMLIVAKPEKSDIELSVHFKNLISEAVRLAVIDQPDNITLVMEGVLFLPELEQEAAEM